MDDEFTKILLNTDAHSTLYVERFGCHSYCVSGSYDVGYKMRRKCMGWFVQYKIIWRHAKEMTEIPICVEFTSEELNTFTTRWATYDTEIVAQSLMVVADNWVWSHDLRWIESHLVKRWSYLMRVVTTILPSCWQDWQHSFIIILVVSGLGPHLLSRHAQPMVSGSRFDVDESPARSITDIWHCWSGDSTVIHLYVQLDTPSSVCSIRLLQFYAHKT